jgi:hypothetical protein
MRMRMRARRAEAIVEGYYTTTRCANLLSAVPVVLQEATQRLVVA